MAGYVSDPWGADFGSSVGKSVGLTPTNTTATTSNNTAQPQSAGGFGASDYLAAAQLIYGVYNNEQAKKKSSSPPKFVNVPLSPEQQKLWDLFYANQTDPTTAKNKSFVSDYSRGALAGMPSQTWEPLKTSTGETGVTTGPIGAAGGVQGFDWGKYIDMTKFNNGGAGGNSGGGGSTAPPPTTPTPDPRQPTDGGAGGGPGSLHDGILTPTFQREEPGSFGSGGPTDGESIYDYLTRNPGGDPKAFLPNHGESAPNPSASSPNTPKLANGTPITPEMLKPGSGTQQDFSALDDFYRNNPTAPEASVWQQAKDLISKFGNSGAVKWVEDHQTGITTGAGAIGGPAAAIGVKGAILLTKFVTWLASLGQGQPTTPTTPTTPPPSGRP